VLRTSELHGARLLLIGFDAMALPGTLDRFVRALAGFIEDRPSSLPDRMETGRMGNGI
jgi:hypothetical protein